ncbi:MAG: transketolase [Candidatus Micrarchaeota archaeon]
MQDRKGSIKQVEQAANEIRKNVLGMCHRANSSHVGSCFSCIDILAQIYVGGVLNVRPAEPEYAKRDYFILSKGHAAAALYATLAQAGFFPPEELLKFYSNGSRMGGHPSKGCVPGVEVSTGSLGHGLGLGCGMAEEFALSKRANRVFVLLSDGELDEGSVWEAILFAGAKKLQNIVAIVDFNKIQSFERVEDAMPLEPLGKKFEAFGWEVARVDGNDVEALASVFSSDFMKSKKPKAIIADTIKGKGVSYMENRLEWHYKSPNEQQYAQGLKELGENEV